MTGISWVEVAALAGVAIGVVAIVLSARSGRRRVRDRTSSVDDGAYVGVSGRPGCRHDGDASGEGDGGGD